MSAPAARLRLPALALAVLLGAAAAGAAVPAAARTAAPKVLVLRAPDAAASLAARWDWAARQSAGAELGRGGWIGYSIRRRMPSNWFMGSWGIRRDDPRTLAQVLAGEPIPVLDEAAKQKAVKEAARKALDEMEGKREPVRIVDKEIALLVRLGPAPGRGFREIEACDLALQFDPEGLPIAWLGRAADVESEALLERLFAGPGPEELKKDIVGIVGMHQSAPGVLPFLERCAAAASPEAIRREAADALGEQTNPRAVAVLKSLAANDRSEDVREDAVSALATSSVPESVEALAALSASKDEKLRRAAIEGLAEKAAEAALPDYEPPDDKEADVKREAVSALAEWPVKEALPRLVELAGPKSDPVVRRAALEALGEMDDPGAAAALLDILRRLRK